MRVRSVIAALVVAAASGTAASPSYALSAQATSAALAKQMRPAGGASGAYVVDLDTGRTVYALRAGTRRMPASVEKLYTTSTALLRLGADTTLRTDVLATQPIGIDGTLDGDLYLRGGGDPTLTSAGLRSLAHALVKATGLSRVTGTVVGDEDAFDELRGPPSEGYGPSVDVQPLGALMVDRGRTGIPAPYWQSGPAAWAATRFAGYLKSDGVRIKKAGVKGTTPPGALALAARDSPPVAKLIALANIPSDNYIAETLLKAIAAGSGAGTTARGASIVRRTVAATYGVHPSVVDGSGLSRSDRTSPKQVVRLLDRVRDRPEGPALFDSLAVAGRTGTLEDRLRTGAARDRCRGKTGTLRDVSNLAGYCQTTGGDTLAFAILMNAVNPYAAHKLQDRMVNAIARYSG